MSGKDDAEKSHEPTQKKLDDARKKGEVPKSNDLITASVYAGLLLALLMTGANTVKALGGVMMAMIEQADSFSQAMVNAGSPITGGLLGRIGLALLPWFVLPMVFALVAAIGQRALIFAPSKLQPKLSRISLISNIKNKFGRGGLFEFAKSFAKLIIISICLGLFLSAKMELMAVTVQTSPAIAMNMLANLCIEFLFFVCLIALSIGVLDYMWQRAEHMRKNMMSLKDMRDEHKESEGDPHMKGERRARGQAIASQQMMADVPTADVVIVNPTHFSVALKWSRKKGEAPICVAKGVDEVAKTIREIAQKNGVPLHSDPPTARALFATTEIGNEISTDHYKAVAAAIRFAETMRKKAKWGRT